MKTLNIEPRTPAWHTARSESWTASSAATLVARENAELLQAAAAKRGIVLDIGPLLELGMATFFDNTPWRVWAEKMGRVPRFMGNADTERGTNNEEKVVCHLEGELMIVVEREVTALSSDYEGFLASFDALAPASSDTSVVAPYGFPVEAKCPAFHSRKKLWDSKKAGKLAILGLPYYWCQVQHQMLVAEAPYAWFVAAGVEKDADTGEEKLVFPIVEKVPRDDRFLTAYEAIAKFYHEEYIMNFNEPPKLPQDEAYLAELALQAEVDKALAAPDEHEVAVDLYLAAVKAEAVASERRKTLEAQLVKAAAKMRVEGVEFVTLADKLQVVYGKNEGAVAWKKVAEQVAKDAGMADIPAVVVEACRSAAKETVKLKEVA